MSKPEEWAPIQERSLYSSPGPKSVTAPKESRGATVLVMLLFGVGILGTLVIVGLFLYAMSNAT